MFFDLQGYVRVPGGFADPPPRPIHTQFTGTARSRIGLVMDQDSYNLAARSEGHELQRSYKGLLINYRERRIRHMHKVIDDYLEGPDR